MEELKFPIGRFQPPGLNIGNKERFEWIQIIEEFPQKLKVLTEHWDEAQWNKPYRPEGWTALQLIHHVADSHSQALGRIKMALTEENPTIKPYDQDGWAGLADNDASAIYPISIIFGVHFKWAYLLKSLSLEDWERTFFHPENGKLYTLSFATAFYAWHTAHHFAHLKAMEK
ncbi:MAG: metal-dependent hydrolase [Bacteroidota bacterium]|jgi:hypothetical protein